MAEQHCVLPIAATEQLLSKILKPRLIIVILLTVTIISTAKNIKTDYEITAS